MNDLRLTLLLLRWFFLTFWSKILLSFALRLFPLYEELAWLPKWWCAAIELEKWGATLSRRDLRALDGRCPGFTYEIAARWGKQKTRKVGPNDRVIDAKLCVCCDVATIRRVLLSAQTQRLSYKGFAFIEISRWASSCLPFSKNQTLKIIW